MKKFRLKHRIDSSIFHIELHPSALPDYFNMVVIDRHNKLFEVKPRLKHHVLAALRKAESKFIVKQIL